MRVFLSLRELSLPRRFLATLATPLAYGAWDGGDYHSGLTLYALFGASIALHVRGLGVHLVVRAVLALQLFLGVLHGRPLPVLAAAIALLALGQAGLGARTGSSFVPIKGRGALLVANVLGLMQFELLLALTARHMDPFLHGRRVVVDLVLAALVSAGVWGVLRLRVWALFALPLAGSVVAALGSLGYHHRLFGVVVLPLADVCELWGSPYAAVLVISLAIGQLGCVALVLRFAFRGEDSRAADLTSHVALPLEIIAR